MTTVALTRPPSQVPLRKGGERGLFRLFSAAPKRRQNDNPLAPFSKGDGERDDTERDAAHPLALPPGRRDCADAAEGDLCVCSSMPQGLLFSYRTFSAILFLILLTIELTSDTLAIMKSHR